MAARVRGARARRGSASSSASWSASQFVPRVVTAFGGTRPENRASVAVLFLVLAATVGQIGRARARRARAPLHARAQAAAALGPCRGRRGRRRSACSSLLWMVIPSFATAKGWPARMARGSTIVAAIERWAPQPTRALRGVGPRDLRRAVPVGARARSQSPPNPGPPPGTSITPAVNARVRASTVKVAGPGVRRDPRGERLGRGARPRRHQRARGGGREGHRRVQDGRAGAARRRVVAFDPVRDVAVLDVPGGLGRRRARSRWRPARSAASARSTATPAGAARGVTGPHRRRDPRGRVPTSTAPGTSRRHVYVLAAVARAGRLRRRARERAGKVIGMAFAIDPGRNATAYALTDAEIDPVLRTVLAATRHPSAPAIAGG